MELGGADRARDLRTDRAAGFDVRDAARCRTTSGPTPFIYRYRFASEGVGTIIHLDAGVELPGVAAVLGPLAARAVKRGVDANLAALKLTLESTATS